MAEGVLTSDLPTNTQFLTPHFWLNNGTTAAAVELAVVSLYAEPVSLLGSRGSVLASPGLAATATSPVRHLNGG